MASGTSFTVGDSPSTGGYLSNAGTITAGTGTWTFNGISMTNTGSGTITAPNIDLQIPALGNSYGFDLNIGPNSSFKTVKWALSQTYLIMTVATGTSFSVGDSPTTGGALSNTGNITCGSGTWTQNGAITINNGGVIDFRGCNLSSGTAVTSAGTMKLTGDQGTFPAAPTLNASSTVEYTATTSTRDIKNWTYTNATLKINGVGGVFTLPGAKTFYAVNTDAGIFSLNGQNLTTTNAMTVASGATLRLAGDETITNGSSVLNSGSTVEYVATGTTRDIKDWTYTNATLKINGTGGTFTLPADLSVANLLVTAGTLDEQAHTVTLSNDLTINGGTLISTSGTMSVGGTWLLTSGTFTHNAGTVDFTAMSGTKSITSGEQNFNNIILNGSGGTFALQDATTTLAGSLTVTAGTLVPGSNAISVSGDWTLGASGIFTPGTSRIVFGGTGTSTVSGNTTFYNLTSVTADKVLAFESGSTQTINGALNITGTSGHEIILSRSGGTGTDQWNIDIEPAGTSSVSYARVSNSNASGLAIITQFSTDGGNNTNWTFPFSGPYIWDGSASTDWFTAANWDTNSVPTTTDDVIIDGGYTNAPTLSVIAGSVTIASLTIGSSTNSTTTLSYGTSTKRLIVTGNLTVGPYGVLTHTDNSTSETHALWVDVGGDFTLSTGGIINVDARGYDGGYGPGKGTIIYSGGAYGGLGSILFSASSSGVTYGSITAPINLGSGGRGGPSAGGGGGSVILNITGSIAVNGIVTAQGETVSGYGSGAGSGGSIYIRAATINGGGIIRSDGGDGTNTAGAGAGGGGRVSVVLDSGDFGSFSGIITALGGDNANVTNTYDAAAGTVYKETQAQGTNNGTLIIDNGNLVASSYITTPVTSSITELPSGPITLQNKGNLLIESGVTFSPLTNTITLSTTSTLQINSGGVVNLTGGTLTGDNNNSYLKINGGTFTTSDTFSYTNINLWLATSSTFNPATLFTVGSGAKFTTDVPQTFSGNVTVASGAVMSHSANGTTAQGEMYKVNLTIGGDLTVDGSINVDGKGYSTWYGPGAPTIGIYNGGSYGGMGGDFGSTGGTRHVYGSVTAPVNLGSGGYASAGGGAILLDVNGLTSISGTLSAGGLVSNGSDTGSGGSVYIITGTISGAGTLRANGGNRGNGGSGSGGRIAIILDGSQADFSGFGGASITAYGGSGNTNGAAGTVYKQTQAQGTNGGDLIINNNNISTASGIVTSISASTTDTTVGSFTLTASKAGKLTIDPGQTLTIQATGTPLTVGTGTTLINNGSLSLSGTTFTNAGTVTMSATSTTSYTGQADDSAVTMLNVAHGALNLNNTGTTFNLPATNFDVNGNLTITAGSLDVTASNYILKLAGDFINSAGAGGFVPRAGTVTLDGSNQSILGSSTFYNLTKSTTTAYTLTFGDDTTQTIGASGRLTLRGSSAGRMSLRTVSDNGTAKFNIDDNGSEAVAFVNVKDGTALHSITANQSIDSGGNTNWLFSSFVMWQFQDF